MPDYDFRSLSDYDFEILSRDLLQKELAITLESFTKGKDGGIDFRYVDVQKTLVVQCKHYASYAQLLRVLKKSELKKLVKLKPARYILTVSTPLTPPRKAEIMANLAPYLSSTGDIYGRDDLNNLLGRYPDIEQKNFRLWLTSESVLNRVLNSAIWVDSDLTLERIRRRASVYVNNSSLPRAREILEEHHHCIVAGIPGIGKTTLAEILLIEYVDRHDFEAVRITNDLSEIKGVRARKKRQIFYFDDFLGTTALEKLQRNEDKQLIEFIDEVSRNENWRFLMTTREYILNAARMRYESISNSSPKLAQCIVELADYTNPIRARILYNHIYFSDLPIKYRLALLREKRYLTIIQHQNYNPRIVEHMTAIRNAELVAADHYYREFLDNLDNPSRVWNHAFRFQLGEAAQHLLIIMVSLGDQTLIDDLRHAFGAFYQFRRNKLGFTASSRDFEHALKQLDGNFIKTRRVGRSHVVEFHNPSVRDYMELYLAETAEDVGDVVRSAVFFDQLERLWQGKRGKKFDAITKYSSAYIEQLGILISSPTSRLNRVAESNEDTATLRHLHQPIEVRCEFIIEVVAVFSSDQTKSLLTTLFATIDQRIADGASNRDALIHFLTKLQATNLHPDQTVLLRTAAKFMAQRIDTLEEYDSLVRFNESFPQSLETSDLQMLRDEFLEFCREYDASEFRSPDDLNSEADLMERVGRHLSVDVDEVTEMMRIQAAELDAEESEPAWEREERFDEEDVSLGRSEGEAIEGMFDRLYESTKEDS